MRTFALDISTIATGWAIFDGTSLQKYNVIKPDSEFSESEKYFYITQSVATLLRLYKPTDLAIEDTFYSKDPTVLKKLNRLAGQIMYIWYTLSKKDPVFYMASSARKTAEIDVRGTKKEITEAVNKKFGLRGRLKDHNMADAILVGYCHWVKTSMNKINVMDVTGSEEAPRRKARRVRPKRNSKRIK